jgi:uncharacterized Zn-binding protein involved in type VI secretion
MPEVARVDDKTSCPKIELLPPFPHWGGPLSNAMPVCLRVDGRPVIRLADYGHCLVGPLDVVFEGAATVVLCGLPVARKKDHMVHGGEIAEGSPNCIIGGPSFALSPNVSVVGPADFQNKVIRDLYLLSTTPSGKDMLDKLGTLGKPLSIEPESDPHNSFCTSVGGGPGDATNGTGTGSRVNYNPEVALMLYDDKGNQITAPPQVILGHEMVHALNNAQGTNKPGHEVPGSGLGPASQPGIALEEEQTIGTGQFDGTSPTENSIRSDLGLPRRDNHYGTGGVREWDTEEERNFLWFTWKEKVHHVDRTNEIKAPTQDLRPGAC